MKPTHKAMILHLRGPLEGISEEVLLVETKKDWVAKKFGTFRKQDGTPVGARYKPPYKLVLKTVTPLQIETEVECEHDAV